jgi:hypothetical protein
MGRCNRQGKKVLTATDYIKLRGEFYIIFSANKEVRTKEIQDPAGRLFIILLNYLRHWR